MTLLYVRWAGMWAIALLVSLGGCRGARQEIHLIPDGYIGPVVIMFGSPTGEDPIRERGVPVYRIPTDGILLSRDPHPPAGYYRYKFYYVTPNGVRKEVLQRGDRGSLQIFGHSTGMTPMVNGGGVGDIRWMAYIVGIPSAYRGARRDQEDPLDLAIEEGVRRVVSSRQVPVPPSEPTHR